MPQLLTALLQAYALLGKGALVDPAILAVMPQLLVPKAQGADGTLPLWLAALTAVGHPEEGHLLALCQLQLLCLLLPSWPADLAGLLCALLVVHPQIDEDPAIPGNLSLNLPQNMTQNMTLNLTLQFQGIVVSVGARKYVVDGYFFI